jgi:adenylosuccinate synthase
MGRNKIVVGCQWGDEGKGKVVDLLAAEADLIVRFQGGANAGHTIVIGDTTYKLNLIPSGILQPDKQCYMGNGMVLDPFKLLDEIKVLKELGIDATGRIHISPAAHLVMPYHKMIDEIQEERRGHAGIGTTKRGIGPCYVDKIARSGIRLIDLTKPERLKSRLEEQKLFKSHYFDGNDDQRSDLNWTFEQLMSIADQLIPMIVDVSKVVVDASKAGKTILFEGAQGALLDVDMGTYPFATSSNTITGGALTGLGVGPRLIDEVVGIVKAYTTRVGAGPFPTELHDDMGNRLRDVGHEYGTATGRPRRCGWLDLPILRYSVRMNGVDSIAVTKIDVLDDLSEINVCTHYELNGERLDDVPLDLADLEHVTPVYKTLPGWMADSTGCGTFDELPEAARDYLTYVADELGVRILLVSTGANRKETIIC